MGGADALAQVKTVSMKATVKHWEPEQSAVADGEMRFAADATIEVTGDFATHTMRIDWVKNFAYPAPRTFRYSEIVTPQAGYVLGVDSNGRNKQSMETNPPAHAMSGLRLAATLRELRRASPSLLLEMRNNPDRVETLGDINVGSATYPAASYRAGNTNFIVMFDPQSGLPARIRTADYDYVWGDVNYDLVLSDWKSFGGIRIATTQKYEFDGRVVADTRITDVVVNAPVAAGRFDVPASIKAGAAKPAANDSAAQWAIRRQFIGVYLDSDSTSFDARATSSLRLVELAPGVQQVVGGTHNSLLVDMGNYLIMFDAPVSDWQSNWTIAAAAAKYPGKPIKTVILMHHHMDHVGGVRALAAQGATIVVAKGNAAHFRKVLAAPATRNPDLAERSYAGVEIVEVADKQTWVYGTRTVSAFVIDNPHASALMLGYVSDARIGWVDDLWAPGTPLPDKTNPMLSSVVNGVKKAGIAPAKFAGGHGSSGDYAPLAALAGK